MKSDFENRSFTSIINHHDLFSARSHDPQCHIVRPDGCLTSSWTTEDRLWSRLTDDTGVRNIVKIQAWFVLNMVTGCGCPRLFGWKCWLPRCDNDLLVFAFDDIPLLWEDRTFQVQEKDGKRVHERQTDRHRQRQTETDRDRQRERETCKELLFPFESRALCTGLRKVLESGPPERYWHLLIVYIFFGRGGQSLARMQQAPSAAPSAAPIEKVIAEDATNFPWHL